MSYLIVGLLLLLFFIYFRSRQSAGSGKIKALRNEARRLLKLNQTAADQAIDRLVSSLKTRHPDQSEQWYLEKLIYDLERDR